MNIQKRDLQFYSRKLIEFSGKPISVKGTIKLRVTVGIWPSIVNLNVDFLFIDTQNTIYNVILGRTSLNKVKAIVSTPHLLMKFQTPYEVSQVRANQAITRRCYMTNL